MLSLPDLKASFSNEKVLLILLSRIYFSTSEPGEVTEFLSNHDIDWELLSKIIGAHGLRPFVYHNIRRYNIQVNPEFEETLRKSYERTRFKNLRNISATTQLIRDFQNEGIFVIPYKGATFALAYYEDLALRESIDIDLIVSKKDVAKAEDYLIGNNYKPVATVRRSYLGYYKFFFKDMVYSQSTKNGAVVIELHWRLMDRFSGSFPSYPFFSAGLVTSPKAPYIRLSPSHDFLATVSNHLVKDMCIKFKYLINIASIIRREGPNLDTKLIFDVAKSYGFQRKLDMGLSLVEELLGISFTPKFPCRLKPEILQTPLKFPILLPRLYINEPHFLKRSLQLQDSLKNRLKFILRCLTYVFLPTLEDINQSKLPIFFLPLLIITRPLRLIYLSVSKSL